MSCIETVVQSIRQTASASAPIARTLETSLHVTGATNLAQTAANVGQLLTGITQINTALEAIQFIVTIHHQSRKKITY